MFADNRSLNHADSFKTNQMNFLKLIILTKKIIWNLYLKEKSYFMQHKKYMQRNLNF